MKRVLSQFIKFVAMVAFLGLSSCKKTSDSFGFVDDTTPADEETPDAPQIVSATPSGATVVMCVSDNVRCGTSPTLTNGSTQSFAVSATGAAPITYEWKLDGTLIPGATTGIYNLVTSPTGVGPGTYSLSVTATNSAGSDTHTFTVKVNEPPELGSSSPSNASLLGVNYTSLLTLQQLATDANGDAISYVWQFEGATNAALTGSAIAGGSQGVYAASLAHVGNRTIKVIVRDSHYNETGVGKYEPEEYTWNINVNYFSQACNDLAPGGICTVVGRPGLMCESGTADGLYDATLEPIKLKPNYMTDDGNGNLFISDSDNHVIWFHNRSGVAVTRLGRTIQPGKMRVLVGNGAAGKTTDLSGSYTYERYKLNGPMMMAYDSAGDYLYIADYYNHRVVRVGSNGQGRRVFGNESIATNSLATNGDGVLATSHLCGYPVGLALNAAKDKMWVSCTGNGTNNLSAIKEIDMSNADPALWTARVVVGRINSVTAGAMSNVVGTDGVSGFYSGPNAGLTASAATDIISHPGHSFVDGTRVHFLALGGGAGLTAGTAVDYFIRDSVPGVSYKVATVLGGVAVNITTNYTSGTIAAVDGFGLTANAATDIITHNGHPYQDGDGIVFTGLVGGAGLAVGTAYIVRNATANTYQVSATPFGGIVNITSNMTAGGVTRAQAGVQYPWALALDQYENLYWTENGSSGYLRVLKRNAQPASYFDGTVPAPAIGHTLSLSGGDGDSPSNATDERRRNARWRDGRGLAIRESAGTIHGFFISVGLRNIVLYLNNGSGTATIGNNAIRDGNDPYDPDGGGALPTDSYPVGLIWGVYNDPDVPSATTPATNNRLFNPTGLLLVGTDLLLADTMNFVIRKLDVSVNNGAISTVTGGVAESHRGRSDATAAEPAPVAGLYLPDQLVYDNSGINNRILVGDNSTIGASWNTTELIPTQATAAFNPAYRIRSLDLDTGLLSTLVGAGYGNADSTTQSKTTAIMQGLRGMAVTPDGSLIYVDRYQFGGGANRNCQVRVLNMTGSTVPYFGVSANNNVVTTLAGNYALGCASSTATTGQATGLFYPEGVSISGTDLYISEFYRHCILRLDSANNLTQEIGLCGTPGDVNGSFNLARFRYPKQLMQDPRFPTNFFVMDQTDQSSSTIKYVNLSGADCDAGAGHACEVAGSAALDQRVATVLTVNGGYGRAMAYYKDPVSINNDLVCYSSSESHNNTTQVFGNTSYGSHNVICKNRVTGAQSIRIGSSDNAVLGSGRQVDNEDEGDVVSGGVLSTPLNGPAGLAFDSYGNLYISEKDSHVIRKVRKWW